MDSLSQNQKPWPNDKVIATLLFYMYNIIFVCIYIYLCLCFNRIRIDLEEEKFVKQTREIFVVVTLSHSHVLCVCSFNYIPCASLFQSLVLCFAYITKWYHQLIYMRVVHVRVRLCELAFRFLFACLRCPCSIPLLLFIFVFDVCNAF